jgi:predicted dehydrogenase
VGHQERYVFARTGPWTGRGADVSAVLDLMIHDLDLVHRMIPGDVSDVHAKGRATHGGHPDEISAQVHFDNHATAKFVASRISPIRRRGMRAVYQDGVVEIDFVTREVKNTTGQALKPLEVMDPLGESVAAFVDAVRLGKPALVRPEEARRALETALLIDHAATPQTGAQQQALYA